MEAVQGFSGLTSLGSHTGNLVTSLRPEVVTPASVSGLYRAQSA